MQLSLFQPDLPGEKTATPSSSSVFIHGKGPGGEVERKRVLMNELLEPHLPERAVGYVIDWLLSENVHLLITKSRSSKLGDYRPPGPGRPARISVNHNINKYAFLVTLVHEMAHHMVPGGTAAKRFPVPFRKKKRPKPHGPEWQSRYRQLMAPLLTADILPPDVLAQMRRYLENPKASTAADAGLLRALKKYDKPDDSELLENLPFDAVFHLPNGLTFRKKEKVRTRYRCISAENGRTYIFSPMARVCMKGN